MDKAFKAGEGRLWIQENGCLNLWEYWGCYGVGTVSEPRGDVTLYYCPSPSRHGEYEVIGSTQGAPGPVTLSLETPLIVRTKLAELNCPFNLMVRHGYCARPDDPDGWEQILYIHNARVTSRSYDGLVAREPGAETLALVSADVSGEYLLWLRKLSAIEQGSATLGTFKLNDVKFCDAARCASECGPASPGCQVGYAVGDGGSPGDAPLLKTEDGGGSWTDIGTPFSTATDNITAVECVGDLVLLANGTSAAIAYSTDGGTTWTIVSTGFSGGAPIQDLFAFSRNKIWAVGAGGYVYFSADGGASWKVQEDGSITTETLNKVHGADDQVLYAVGNGGLILKTIDGGASWFAVSSPTSDDILTVFAVSRNVVFIGAWNAGALTGGMWYSVDGGENWTEVSQFEDKAVYDIKFCGCNFGFAAVEDDVYRTIDGGLTWSAQGAGAPANLYAVFCCDPNRVYAVGDNGSIKFLTGA